MDAKTEGGKLRWYLGTYVGAGAMHARATHAA
jgi:hypothetical protein